MAKSSIYKIEKELENLGRSYGNEIFKDEFRGLNEISQEVDNGFLKREGDNYIFTGITESETDPIFSAWLATPPDLSEFNNDVGYLTEETDPIFSAWYNSSKPNLNELTINDLLNLTPKTTVPLTIEEGGIVYYAETGEKHLNIYDGTNLKIIPFTNEVLMLDQTTHQHVINGLPVFDDGIKIQGSHFVTGGVITEATKTNNGVFSSKPSNPISTTTNGSGSGCTINVLSWTDNGSYGSTTTLLNEVGIGDGVYPTNNGEICRTGGGPNDLFIFNVDGNNNDYTTFLRGLQPGSLIRVYGTYGDTNPCDFTVIISQAIDDGDFTGFVADLYAGTNNTDLSGGSYSVDVTPYTITEYYIDSWEIASGGTNYAVNDEIYITGDTNAVFSVDSVSTGYDDFWLTSFVGSTSQTEDATYTLPTEQATVISLLKNDGSGNLSWQDMSDFVGDNSTYAFNFTNLGNDRIVLFSSPSSIGATFGIDATYTGGHLWRFQSFADGAGQGGGKFGIYDEDTNTTPFAIDGETSTIYITGGNNLFTDDGSGAILQVNGGVSISENNQLMFRDTEVYIASLDDGHLDIMADVSIDLNTAADTDLVVNFFGTTNSGVLTWMEDEDYFLFSDEILMNQSEKINFRDTAIGIYSQADSYLDLFADGAVRIGDSSSGAPSTYISIEPSGDTYFVGEGSGLPYGSCWGNEIAWSQTSAEQNTWYNISDTDMADGQLNLVTHDGNGKLTVNKAGRYLIDYSLAAEISVANKHIEAGIEISGSGSAVNDGRSHIEAGIATAQYMLSSTAILDLAANDTIEISVRTTDAGTPDIEVDHLNITVTQIGGT